MSAINGKSQETIQTGAANSPGSSAKIDPTALAGTKNSLGQESVHDGRPATDDSVVEAMDEEVPGTAESSNR